MALAARRAFLRRGRRPSLPREARRPQSAAPFGVAKSDIANPIFSREGRRASAGSAGLAPRTAPRSEALRGFPPNGFGPRGRSLNGRSPPGLLPNGFRPPGRSPYGLSPPGLFPKGLGPGGLSPYGLSPPGFPPNGRSPLGRSLTVYRHQASRRTAPAGTPCPLAARRSAAGCRGLLAFRGMADLAERSRRLPQVCCQMGGPRAACR